MKYIIVEGLIGAGKSTLLSILEKNFKNSCCILEPVEEWKESGELDIFYKNLNTDNHSIYSYRFQTYTFITRIKSILQKIKEHPNAEYYFLERSIFSDKYFFIEMLYNSKMLNEQDYKMYNEWWKLWKEVLPFQPSGFIYLNPSVKQCQSRLINRNRESEVNSVSLEYQKDLKKYHDKFLLNDIIIDNKKIECLNLNTNIDFRKDSTEVISQINNFIKQLPN